MKTLVKNNKFQVSEYSFFACAAIITGAQTGNSQVVYTDIDPDISLGLNESFILDSDGDVTGDFEIRQFYDAIYSSFGLVISGVLGSMHPLHSNVSVNADTSPFTFANYPYAYPVYLNEAGIAFNHLDAWKSYFDNAGPFTHAWGFLGGFAKTQSGSSSFTNGPFGDWTDAEYKFAGIRSTDGPHEYYGWVRLSLSENAQVVTIHDYAINMTADLLIKAGATGNCVPPSVSGVSNISSSSAKVTWAPVFGATKYQIYYRPLGVVTWTKLNAGADAKQKTVSGLLCDTEYEWKIRSKCAGMFSDFSAIHTYSTAGCRLSELQNDAVSISVYPNPAADLFMIDVSNFNGDEINIRIFNLMGELIFTENYISSQTIQIDASKIPAGNYILKANSDRKQSVDKIIIQ